MLPLLLPLLPLLSLPLLLGIGVGVSNVVITNCRYLFRRGNLLAYNSLYVRACVRACARARACGLLPQNINILDAAFKVSHASSLNKTAFQHLKGL